MSLLQHRLAIAIVAVAVFATVGTFVFARPAYHAHHGEELKFSEAVPPSHGWRWDDPTPGFHLGEDGDRWNVFLLEPRDIPPSAGVLTAGRFTLQGRPELIYAEHGCIGVRPSVGERRLLCPPPSPVVLVAYAAKPFQAVKGPLYPLFITGVARSDVTRVTVEMRAETFVDDRSGTPIVRDEPPVAAYDAKHNVWWGAFTSNRSQPVPWDATVKVYGKRGVLTSLRIRFRHPGEAIYCPTATSVSCR